MCIRDSFRTGSPATSLRRPWPTREPAAPTGRKSRFFSSVFSIFKRESLRRLSRPYRLLGRSSGRFRNCTPFVFELEFGFLLLCRTVRVFDRPFRSVEKFGPDFGVVPHPGNVSDSQYGGGVFQLHVDAQEDVYKRQGRGGCG